MNDKTNKKKHARTIKQFGLDQAQKRGGKRREEEGGGCGGGTRKKGRREDRETSSENVTAFQRRGPSRNPQRGVTGWRRWGKADAVKPLEEEAAMGESEAGLADTGLAGWVLLRGPASGRQGTRPSPVEAARRGGALRVGTRPSVPRLREAPELGAAAAAAAAESATDGGRVGVASGGGRRRRRRRR